MLQTLEMKVPVKYIFEFVLTIHYNIKLHKIVFQIIAK